MIDYNTIILAIIFVLILCAVVAIFINETPRQRHVKSGVHIVGSYVLDKSPH